MYTSKIKRFHIAGVVFTFIFGSLIHFVYEFSDKNRLAAVFGSVNESTWEHLKMLFWPMVLFGIFEYFAYGRQHRNFIPAKTLSISIGMFFIISVFYTYTGILGFHLFICDILIFCAVIITAYIFSYRTIITQGRYDSLSSGILSWTVLVILITSFILFTFITPEIGLFLDPVTGTYGIGL